MHNILFPFVVNNMNSDAMVDDSIETAKQAFVVSHFWPVAPKSAVVFLVLLVVITVYQAASLLIHHLKNLG